MKNLPTKDNSQNTSPVIESENLNFNEKDRTLEHYVSTEDVNRYGYRLKNSGINETNFRKNPVVLYQHSLGGFCESVPTPEKLIVANNQLFRQDGKGVIAKTKFLPTALGDEIMEFNKNGWMKAWSVSWGFLNPDDNFINEDNIPTVLEWDIREYSAVIIPGNPGAVNNMLSMTKTSSLKKLLMWDSVILGYKEQFDNELISLKEMIQKLSAPENTKDLDNKKLTDLKNELKSVINDHKKQTTELFMGVAAKLGNLETNLHKTLLSKIGNVVESTIRKYLGKVD